MATMKKAAPKAQKGKSVMKAYVDKYKNEGGISNMDIARDTLGGSSPRNNQYNGGFGGGRMSQMKDLQAAHDKKFGKKSTIDERKTGGTVKKAQKGAALTKVTDSIKPPKPNYDGYRPPYVPSGKKSQVNKDLDGLKELYQDGKFKQRRTGGVVKKAQNGIAKYSDPKPLFDKIEKTRDSISTARKKLDATKAIKNKALKSNMNKIKTMKMKNGGSLTGLKASNKRVGPIDPKGAFTKVQKKTLAGARGKATLTKDKQLGATKMTAKNGAKMKKGKSC